MAFSANQAVLCEHILVHKQGVYYHFFQWIADDSWRNAFIALLTANPRALGTIQKFEKRDKLGIIVGKNFERIE